MKCSECGREFGRLEERYPACCPHRSLMCGCGDRRYLCGPCHARGARLEWTADGGSVLIVDGEVRSRKTRKEGPE